MDVVPAGRPPALTRSRMRPRRLLSLEAANPFDHQQALGILGLGGAWLIYTCLSFWLHPRGLTAAPSLFMHVTGHPDPACGLTRTFAWMWRGDLAQALLAYPLGPALFLLSFALLAYSGFVLVRGQAVRVRLPAVRVRLPAAARRLLVVGVVVLFALNWTAKLLWLGV